MKKILPVLFAAAIFSSCDIVEAPYKEGVDTPIDTTQKYVQKVLIEDYTGFYCGNCPRAANQAKELYDLYKNRVVIMGVHVGFFAKPKPNKNDYDFRTEVGTALDNFFGLESAGLPQGMISRIGYPTKTQATPDPAWGTKVQEVLAKEPVLGISLKPEFYKATKTLTLEAITEFLKAAEPDAYLAVYLVEDSIIARQTDYSKTPSEIPDFVHMHVLRGAVNSTWGDQLSTAPIAAGAKFTKNYTYTIPAGKDWKPEHMKIIAFVHRYGSTYEVLNAEEVDLIK
ncbi:MAG TPA: Omp28-related outer membrane protein [Patescibacteria group bacterium]|nr:Omp28-related outer membrane protein [Patescibacteria group bacterium]